MSVSQLRLVTIALIALTVFLLISGKTWFRHRIVPILNKLVVIGVGLLLVGVFILKPEKVFLDTWDNLQTMFVTGKWLGTFWGTVILLFLVKAKERHPFYNFFNIIFYTFFSMIIILGYVIGGYHNQWYVSANRMFIHILPLMIFSYR